MQPFKHLIIHVTTTINDKTQAELKTSPIEKHWEGELDQLIHAWLMNLNPVDNEGRVEVIFHVNVRTERSVHESSYKIEVPA